MSLQKSKPFDNFWPVTSEDLGAKKLVQCWHNLTEELNSTITTFYKFARLLPHLLLRPGFWSSHSCSNPVPFSMIDSLNMYVHMVVPELEHTQINKYIEISGIDGVSIITRK